MTKQIVAITGTLTKRQAERVVASPSDAWTVRACQKLYYPYFWFVLRHEVRTVLGTSGSGWSSLVDARTGVPATADPFELQPIETDAASVLERRLAEHEGLCIARRYVGYVGRNRRRALVAPTLTVVERRLVYKPFWVVEGAMRGDLRFRLLVDGLTGAFHVVGR